MNLNENAFRKLETLENVSGVGKTRFGNSTVLDVGVNAELDFETANMIGKKVAEASMGCLGHVEIDKDIRVAINENVAVATLGCQLAGWSIDINGKNALGSGPARILASKPKDIVNRIEYIESSDDAALILETDRLPGRDVCERILAKTGASRLLITVFSQKSRVGALNVLARIVEMAVFRLYFLGFGIKKILSAEGVVPFPEKPNSFSCNDAIIYNGFVSLKVEYWDPKLTDECVSKSSKIYGKSFREIFDDAGGDFYKIDPDIFAPAEIEIIDGKKVYRAGGRR